tara:strand:+ start:984 stop:1535 length:552 start_codon:yes stop_codon:yes gene_type:complete
MNIYSKNLSLSQIDIKDIDEIHSQTSEYKQIGHLFSTKIRSKDYWLKKYKENGLWGDDYGMLKINDMSDGDLIGVIWYFVSMPYVEGFEIGFNIFNSLKREKGFATEALNIFSSYLFNAYNINRLQCNTYLPINNPSIKTLTEKTGYVYEGSMRKAVYIRGELIDLHLFSLLRENSKKLVELI